MNVYVGIRTILHSLLFLVNLIALTVASGMIAALKGQGHKATAGSVLVILGSIFYAFIVISLWSETCIPRSKLSRNRTEAIVLPILFLYQLIAAIVTTAETSRGVCADQSFCVALLILSWMSTFTLLVYYLITMIVIFYHFSLNGQIWDESPLSYNWFPMPNSGKPALPPKDLIVNPPREIARPPSVDIASIEPPPPSFINQHHHQRSSRTPLFLGPERSASSRPQISTRAAAETFYDIPFGSAPAMEEEDETSRFSFSVPRWAKKLRPARRGVETPFPVTANIRPPYIGDQELRGIDAPVSPDYFTES